MTAFEEVISRGGVVLFPSDTVYGLACDPENAAAIERLYALKGRPAARASAIMFFDLEAALAAVPELGPRTQAALRGLMPGAITALVRNPGRRFPLACGNDPETLGMRVVSVPALAGVRVPVLQSSANPSGGSDARSLSEVAPAMRAGADLVIDGGELPGVSSTVVDLREYEDDGIWSTLRLGAVDGDELARALGGRFHFDPSTYLDMVRGDLPEYDELQEALVSASGGEAKRILDLGTGTGETAVRLVDAHPRSVVFAVDENEKMLRVARERLGARLEGMQVGMLQEPLPEGRFDLVSSALAIHHLDGDEKAELFRRVHDVLVPGGRFVLADLVVPSDGPDAVRGATDGYDKPDTVQDQVRWLEEAGFTFVSVTWSVKDLVVIVADTSR